MEIYGKTEGVPNCCASCVKGDLNKDYNIQCDSGVIMRPTEYCNDNFEYDTSKTKDEVLSIIEDFIEKNSGI